LQQILGAEGHKLVEWAGLLELEITSHAATTHIAVEELHDLVQDLLTALPGLVSADTPAAFPTIPRAHPELWQLEMRARLLPVDSGPAEQIAIALVNKGEMLAEAGRTADAVAVYDDVVRRYGKRSEAAIAEQVAKAKKGLAETEQKGHFERKKILDLLKRKEKRVLLSEEKIKELFASLPDAPRARLEAVPALYNVIRKVAAQELRAAVAAAVEQAATLPYDEMAALSKVVSQALGAAQLAIRDPETGLPATLKPHRPRPSSEARYLRLRDTRAGNDGRQNSLRVDELPPGSIELISSIIETDQTPPFEQPSGRGC